jgi:hypothetical protein
MSDEVNIAAFEGGDTAPGTKEKIAERNQALQAHSDKIREIEEKKAQADQEAYDSHIEAEQKLAEDNQALVMGVPVVSDAAQEGAASESKKKS